MNKPETSPIKLSENMIIADADYIDYVAFQLTVQFERMIDRRLPPVDLSQWIVDIALDGGLRQDGKQHETQVVLVHDRKKPRLENFAPADYERDINAKAFRDEQLGEFLVNAFATTDVAGKDDYILDLVREVTAHEEVRRVMVVPDGEHGDLYDQLRRELRSVDNDQRLTLFAMQPMEGGNFRQEMLGYSLMNALGIKSSEINPQN